MSEQSAKHVPSAKKKTNPLVVIIIIVVVIAVLGFLATMAGSIFFAAKFGEALKKGGVQYAGDKNSFTFKETNGENSISVGQGTQLPADFPKDFPLYAGAQAVSVVTAEDGFTVTFTIRGISGSEVSEWYRNELPKNGWEVGESSGFGVLEFENSSFEGTIVVVDDQANAVALNVNFERK